LKHRFRGEPQQQTISGLISTSYTTSDGEAVLPEAVRHWTLTKLREKPIKTGAVG
jgi:hypothetical protein